jgi:pimeloyl-ACP methyl ester carboxylesterase
MEKIAQAKENRRTYVLVHGAFHGGWCWKRVAERLRARGHTVHTPTQTGLGERRHLLSKDISMDVFVSDIVNVLEAEELREVYLVGHSFGGGTVAGVADRVPDRLKRLVFLDAGIPQEGKSAFDRLPPEVRDARIKAANETSGGLSIPVPPVGTFGLTTQEDNMWVERRLTPHPLNTYMTAATIKNPIGNGVATTYIRCTDPCYSNVGPSAEFAKAQSGWQYLEIQTGHDAMVSAPTQLCDLLCGLA